MMHINECNWQTMECMQISSCSCLCTWCPLQNDSIPSFCLECPQCSANEMVLGLSLNMHQDAMDLRGSFIIGTLWTLYTQTGGVKFLTQQPGSISRLWTWSCKTSWTWKGYETKAFIYDSLFSYEKISSYMKNLCHKLNWSSSSYMNS